MSRERISSIALMVCLLIIVTDFAEAAPRRRRRQSGNNTNYYNEGYGESGFQRVAPKSDLESEAYRRLAVNYSYERAAVPEAAFTDRFRVHLDLWDDAFMSDDSEFTAEVKITDLSKSAKPQVNYYPISLVSSSQQEYRPAVIDVVNHEGQEPFIQPAKTYRLFINLHRKAAEYGDDTVIGSIPVPYYVATSGPTRLDRARHHIVMRTFREFYYTERGWSTDEAYPMDCYAYYMWATGVCTVGSPNDWTILGNLFGGEFPYHVGGQIPELCAVGSIHGDYVRQPGHSFMLLAYDPELEQVWTMEANFGNTIEVVNRYVGAGWTVGHLAEQHIRPELFKTELVSTREPAATNAGGSE